MAGLAITKFMNLIAIPMMIGMAATAAFNAVLAATVDFDEKCAQSDNIRDAISSFQQWASEMATQFRQDKVKLKAHSENLKNKTVMLLRLMKQNKEKNEKQLRRMKISSSIITSIISLVFLLKIQLAYL